MNTQPAVVLGKVAQIFNGKTPSKAEHRTEGFPVLKIRDVDDLGGLRQPRESFVDPEFAERYRSKWIQQGDILILNAAHNAAYVASKTFFAEKSVAGFLPTGEWLLIRSSTDEVLPRFLNFWLRTQGTQKAIRSLIKGIHLYPKDVANLSIAIPPLEKQRRIVEVLGRAAEIRRRAEAAHAKARAIIPALFLATFGDPATNPKGWPIVRVGDLLESTSYGTSQKANDRGEGVPMIRMGNVTIDGMLDTADLKHSEIIGEERAKAEILDGDLLFNRTNSKELVGKTGLWDGRFEAVAASYFIRMRVLRDRCDPTYLWAFFNTKFMKRVLFETARGAIGQANINAKELKAFRVAWPPFALQGAFAEQIERIDLLARKLDAAAAKAEAMAAALSAEVFE